MTTQTLNQPAAEYGADALIVCDNLVRIYQVENIEVQALQGLDLLVEAGELVAIVAVALVVTVLVEGAVRRRDRLGEVLRVGER